MSKKIYVKPSKSQSKFSFFVGIGFCLIGLFLVIPTFGIFGIFWTLIAAWITYSSWKGGFTEDSMPTRVIEIEDTDNITQKQQTYSSNKGESVEERLKSLQNLYDQRLITREEYEQKKQEILKDL